MPTIYHTYANLNQFRDYLAGTQYSSNWTSDAVTLRRILQSASRRMDDYVGGGLLTTWGPYTQSREYDIGTGTLVDDPRNFVPVNSLAPKDQLAGIIPLGSWCNSITSVTSYTQTDRAESESLSPGYNADYWEIPYSTDPKYAIKINEDSQKTLFNAGQGTLVIAASWGWQNVTKSVTTITANITTTSATTVALTSVDDVAEGSTILIGTEQMYVESISSLNATVIRGVHGTTAATHTSGADVSTIQYPEDVIQTCLDIGHVIYRDRDIGFSDRLENSTSVDMRNSLANLDGYKSHSNTAGAVF
tara:strand:- start:864 stop:1775 length:912 start_codon:yes stop_codon:yes gene_type:complete